MTLTVYSTLVFRLLAKLWVETPSIYRVRQVYSYSMVAQ